MPFPHLLSVWVHIVAAAIWIGGMFFIALVVVPLLRRGDRAQAAAFLHIAGIRFRNIGWTIFAILFVTGTIQLGYRGFALSDVVEPGFLASPFGRAFGWKILLFTVVLAASGWHDFVVGPQATDAARTAPGGPQAERLRRQASLIGRLNALLALAIVALAVVMVRGWPG